MSLNLSAPVLIVDDHPTMVSIVSNVLRQIGFADVDRARCGQTAMRKMSSKNYGLVISDERMSRVAGGDLLRQMRADPKLAATPFVMMTAESATAEPACATISRPFNARMLQQRLRDAFPG